MKVAGFVTVTSLRGWLSTRAKMRGGKWFTFANTHLEAFDDCTQVPSIRAKQAKEFAKAMGKVKGPLIAVGDFNSDFPGLVPGDEQAFEVLRKAGFKGHRHDHADELLHRDVRRPAERRLHRRVRPPRRPDLHHHPEEGQEDQDLGRRPGAVLRVLAPDHAGVVGKYVLK